MQILCERATEQHSAVPPVKAHIAGQKHAAIGVVSRQRFGTAAREDIAAYGSLFHFWVVEVCWLGAVLVTGTSAYVGMQGGMYSAD